MLVVYKNDTEAIVCEKKNEAQMKREFFGKGMGREIEEYDRDEIKEVAVMISPRIHMS